jgi:hypothetical protein
MDIQYYRLTLESQNKKTGPIPVSTTSSNSCWDGCAFHGDGCYAQGGNVAMRWRETDRGEHSTTFEQFSMMVERLPEGQLWRHNQAGDLPGIGAEIAPRSLERLVEANRGRKGFTYTHKPVLGDDETAALNRASIAASNLAGFTINLSGNTLDHADRLSDLGIAPVTVVLDASWEGRARAGERSLKTPAGRTVSVCPATYRDDVQCIDCKLCAVASRPSIIGFPAHGSGKKRASRVANG